jgi:Divergent InlB B-repeat domain/Viral BACON domain
MARPRVRGFLFRRSFPSFVFLALLLAFARAADAQTTALFFDSQAGDYIGAGVQHTYLPSDATFAVTRSSINSVSAQVDGPSFSFWWSLDFGRLGEAALTPGAYGGARDFYFTPGNGMDVGGSGRGCDTITGRFVVLEAVYAGDGSVVSFAVDFEQHCENNDAALFGAFRYNSSISDLRPFGGDYPHIRLRVATPSHGTVTGGGLNCDSTGTGCSVDFGSDTPVTLTATPDAGYIFAGWTGDCTGGPTASVTVNAWKDCAAFFQPSVVSSRTLLWLDSRSGDPLGGGSPWVLTPSNSEWGTPQTSSAGGFSVNIRSTGGQDEILWGLSFSPPQGAALQAGVTYEHATKFNSVLTPGLSINGLTFCSGGLGRFTVLDWVVASDGTVLRFAADFEEHCDNGGPGLYGGIRYASTTSDVIPFGGVYPAYSLTVATPVNGTISGDGGINCGPAASACSATLMHAGSISLAATAAPGYIFAGWTGDCVGSTSALSTFVNRPESCAALFEPIVTSTSRNIVRWTSETIDSGLGPQSDAIGQGRDGVFVPAGTAWSVQAGSTNSVALSIIELFGSTTSSWQLRFGPPAGQTLATGMYLHAVTNAGASALMSISGEDRTCAGAGRFLVRERVRGADGSIQRLAIDFEQHCGLVVPALIGVVRFNSTVTGMDAFDGDYDVYRVRLSRPTHGTVTGAGFDCGTNTSVCEIAPGMGATPSFSAAADPGYAFAGWTGDCHGGASTLIFVNGPKVCTPLFESAPPATPPTSFQMTSDPSNPIGRGRSEFYTLANSVWSLPSNGGSTLGFSVTGPGDAEDDQWVVILSIPAGQSLQVGMQYVASVPFETGGPRILLFAGTQSCGGGDVGTFTIRDLELTGTTVTRAAVDMEDRCQTLTAPAARFSIRYNSTIDDPPPPTVSIDRTKLSFAATLGSGAFAAQTGVQTIRLTQSGAGAVSWTASSNVPWLVVSPASGTGTATLSASVRFDPSLPLTPGTVSGSIIIVMSGAANSVGPINVGLNLVAQSTSSGFPFGSFDTPGDGSTGLNGSIAVTGWALDDIEVTGVRIMRDPVAGEAPGSRVFIGNAVLIDGARPDVGAAFAQMPLSTRGGWGYLLLTNMLPNGGNGAFTLYAYADDVDGHTTLLGTKTITCDNADATAPFGAIDTPGQGDVVSGVVTNFGWVLSPGQRRADPPGGGTVTVYVDGAPVGGPGGWTSRSDLSGLFPLSQYAGVETALGVFGLDTTTLVNGVHTLAWSVTDTLGVTSGVGSRFFTVSNGAIQGSIQGSGSGDLGTARAELAAGTRELAAGSGRLAAARVLLGRRGFDLTAPLQYFFPDAEGVVTIEAQELDRIELQLEPGATGVQMTPRGERPLPAGARIDPVTGVFTWAPGAGFVGAYDFVLGPQRVHIVLHPKGADPQ